MHLFFSLFLLHKNKINISIKLVSFITTFLGYELFYFNLLENNYLMFFTIYFLTCFEVSYLVIKIEFWLNKFNKICLLDNLFNSYKKNY